MSIVTISTIATSGVTLTSALRGSTLTVTGNGGIVTGTGPALTAYGSTGTLNVAVVNYGTLMATSGFAATLSGHVQFYNYGYAGGVSGIGFGGTYSNGLLENAASGTIAGNGTTAGEGIGISFGGNNTLLNLGSIHGASTGIYAGSGAGLQNYGVITGGTTGIIFEQGSLANLGTIIGGSVGIESNGGWIANSGSIVGRQTGIAATATSILNTSTVYGSLTGISTNGGSVTNSGSVGGGQIGIYASAASVFNQVGGVITGGVSLVGGYVANTGSIGGTIGIAGTDSTIVNAGIISGSAYAILGSTLDVLVETGSVIQGAVADTSGHGRLTLAGSTAGSLDISSFSGFATIDLATAGWTLAGSIAQLASGETITGFQRGDEIILEGFSASSETYAPGSGLLVLSNASASETLALSSPLAQLAPLFNASADGTTLRPSNELLNSGTLIGETLGLSLALGYTLINTGQITATGYSLTDIGIHYTINKNWDGRGVVAYSYANIVNTGRVSGVEEALDFLEGGKVTNAGTLAATGSYSSTMVDDYDISPYPSYYVTQGIGYAVLNASGDFTLTADPGAVFIGDVADMADTGLLVLGSGGSAGSLDVASFFGFETINFAPGGSWLLEGNVGQLADGQTITGFSAGDTLVINNIEDYASFFLTGFSASSESFVTGTGLVLSNATASETIDITGTFASSHFTITSTAEGTEVTAPCFCRGTRIATPRGPVPVENLRVDDRVRTDTNGARAIRWIGQRAYDGTALAGNHLALPVKIRRHALGFNVPSRDLFVSPDHAICEGGVLVHAWRLVNGASITQPQHVERVEYFHFELDTHDIVFAENAPTETFLDASCRTRFELAEGVPGTAATPCRPRVEDGYYLERLRARINARAGLQEESKIIGPIRGNLDERGARLRGWAQDEAAPEQPVELELLSDGRVVQRFLANRYRADLRRAGLGSGCHAFDVARPEGDVTLRRAGGGQVPF